MIFALQHFALGMVLSFIGSIPFGTINVTTAETAFRDGMRVAFMVAVGAALVECLQALTCLFFSSMITNNPVVTTTLEWAAIPVFLGLAVYFYRRRHAEPATRDSRITEANGFVRGVIVSALNFLAWPYWVFYSAYLDSVGWIDLDASEMVLVFCGGVLVGTVLILSVYARIGQVAGKKYRHLNTQISIGLCLFFIAFAFLQTARLTLLK